MTQPMHGGFCSFLRVGLRGIAASEGNLLIRFFGMGVAGSDLSTLRIRAFQLGASDASSVRDRLTLLRLSAEDAADAKIAVALLRALTAALSVQFVAPARLLGHIPSR